MQCQCEGMYLHEKRPVWAGRRCTLLIDSGTIVYYVRVYILLQKVDSDRYVRDCSSGI